MHKAVKKLRKLKDQLDKLEEKEDDLLNQIDEAIDELEESDEEQDVESRHPIYSDDGDFLCRFTLFSNFNSSLSVIFMQQCDIYVTLVPTKWRFEGIDFFFCKSFQWWHSGTEGVFNE